jgi:hypothetical protein
MGWLAGVSQRRPTTLNADHRFMIKDVHRRNLTISDIVYITAHERETIRAILNDRAVRHQRSGRPGARNRIDPLSPVSLTARWPGAPILWWLRAPSVEISRSRSSSEVSGEYSGESCVLYCDCCLNGRARTDCFPVSVRRAFRTKSCGRT